MTCSDAYRGVTLKRGILSSEDDTSPAGMGKLQWQDPEASIRKNMRTFIAIELPRQIKDKLTELQILLKQTGADVKWVFPKNIHLTLKFLGEIDEKQLPEIIQIIEGAAKNNKTFQASLSSYGVFPKIEFPRVIWVAVNKGDNETKKLAEELENGLEQIGIPKEEKAFSSHITIGRVKSQLNKEKLVKALKESGNYFEGENTGFDINKITLFKSTLNVSGPAYDILKEVSLTTT